jgi:TRAP-type C4-dicarboxylate transport system substrate-binding protein
MEWLVISAKALDTLPDEYKKVLVEEANKWGEDCRAGVANEVKNALATLEQNGMTMNELTSTEREAWRTAAMTVWDEWATTDPSNAEALKLAKAAMGL